MRTLCYSVRMKRLVSISDKSFRAICFDGATDIIPKSQVFGRDWDVMKSEAWWISAWILEKKSIQYSHKKSAYFDSNTGKMLPTIIVEKHNPERMGAVEDNIIGDLRK